MFDDHLVLNQLRCCGVLEVVRIAREGYPTRWEFVEFTERFGFGDVAEKESKDSKPGRVGETAIAEKKTSVEKEAANQKTQEQEKPQKRQSQRIRDPSRTNPMTRKT